MKKVILFDPAISSMNLGDKIISESCRAETEPLLRDNFIVDICTHLPLSNQYLKILGNADYRLLLGSNLLRGKMDRRFRQWDINCFNAEHLSDIITLGVGWWSYGDDPNGYTKRLYQSVLSHDMLHSVRDDYTKSMMERMGFNNVVNTGCPTMWRLTKRHCEAIPTAKADTVVFTVTDYRPDGDADKKLVDTLLKHYSRVMFWIQGLGDLEYLSDIIDIEKENIGIIGPRLDDYVSFLRSCDCDYVGTRLHAGIKAMQEKKRSVIIGVDNRSAEKKKDFNINCLGRERIAELGEFIEAPIKTDIRLREDAIARWKAQFTEFAQDMPVKSL